MALDKIPDMEEFVKALIILMVFVSGLILEHGYLHAVVVVVLTVFLLAGPLLVVRLLNRFP